MNRWRHGLQQIGGPNAISIWSWVITIPLALFVSSTYLPNPSLVDVVTWMTIVLVIHCLLGGVMWLATKTILPTTERRSQPLIAMTFFALLGVARGLLLQFAQDTVGVSESIFAERMATNILGSVIALSLIAIVVDDYRTDESIVDRLESANETLTQLRDREEAALQAADVDVIEEVRLRIEAELQSAGTDSTRVRAVADSIVRPLSHELAESSSTSPLLTELENSRRGTLTFSQAFAHLQAPSPLAVVVLVELGVLGPVVARFGPLIAFVNLLVGGTLLFVGCWLIKRLLPLPAGALARLAVLIVALSVVGVVGTEVTSLFVSQILVSFPVPIVGATSGVVGAGVVVSLWAAVNAGRRARQEAMTRAVAEEASAVERLRSLIEQRRLQAARFLHGPIQGDLIAAAMKGDSPDHVRRVIARRFTEYDSLVDAGGVEQLVRDVVAAWSAVLTVTVTIEPDVWTDLASDPARGELVVDAISEGLTNAVRHSRSRVVEIRGRTQPGRVHVEVISEGSAASSGVIDGIGLAQLRSRGALVELHTRDERTVLTVET